MQEYLLKGCLQNRQVRVKKFSCINQSTSKIQLRVFPRHGCTMGAMMFHLFLCFFSDIISFDSMIAAF